MPTDTLTKTKTKTKLLIATAALAAAGGLAFIMLPRLSSSLTTTKTAITSTSSLICVDSDGGNKPGTKGTASVQDTANNYNVVTSGTDYCIFSTALIEFNCLSSSTIEQSLASCTYGCTSGFCASQFSLPTTLPKTEVYQTSTNVLTQ
ncbi:MAG: hypothetical protein G01um101413_545 [Parcubacteria group bacterium Gr01-1014_13]|nr:MAG: hypothetical protein G01um101413_545 [Parcubacteria group bacterium Gr01-1014_13]